MLRVTTAFAAALVLVLPFGCPFLVGLTPAIGLGAGLLTTQRANAQTAEDWFDDGNQKFVSGDYAGAFSDYTKAIEIKPMYARAYFNRGTSKDELNDYQGAIADYTKAIEFKPDYYKAYTNRGITLEKAGQLKGACMDWKKAVDLGDTKPIEWVRNQC